MRQLRTWEWLLILLSAVAIAFLAGYFAGQQSLEQGDGGGGHVSVETEHSWQPGEAADTAEPEEITPEAKETADPAEEAASYGGESTAPEEENLWKSYKLNPNTNTAANIRFFMMPWIDEELAEAIVAYRKENGDYQYLEDLLKVPGMTEELLEEVEARIDLPSRG